MTNGGVDRSRRSAGNLRNWFTPEEIGSGRLVVWLFGQLPAMEGVHLPIPALFTIITALVSAAPACYSRCFQAVADANVRFLACVAGKG